MATEIKREEGRNPTLVLSNMGKKEYAIVEKLYDEPKTGSNVGKDGKAFDWRLYSVAVHEVKYFDEDSESMKVEKFDEPETMTLFKNAKTFTELFDEFPVNTKVKITQTKPEGKTYSVFEMEKVGTGNASAPEPDSNAEVSAVEFLQNMKNNGIDADNAVEMAMKKFPDQTSMSLKVIYEGL